MIEHAPQRLPSLLHVQLSAFPRPCSDSLDRKAPGCNPALLDLFTASAGMAGSGKTTLMQRINMHLHEKGMPGYILNLDPAVSNVPYEPNIDIRDTVRQSSPLPLSAVLLAEAASRCCVPHHITSLCGLAWHPFPSQNSACT